VRGLVIVIISLWASSAWALQLSTADAALRRAFPSADRFVSEGVTLTAQERLGLDQSAAGRSLDAYAVRHSAWLKGQLLGTAWQDDEIGKHRPISYLVAMDVKAKIVAVEILTYREAHGLEARSPRFSRQMLGKGIEDRLSVGQDLDAISGATLSCKTLAYGARKALQQDKLYRKNSASPASSPASEQRKKKEQ